MSHIERELHKVAHRTFRNKSELARLSRAEALGRDIARALRSTVERDVRSEEKEYIRKIETLRQEMEASSQQLEILDFGASCHDDPKHRNGSGRAVHMELGTVCRSASKRSAFALLMLKLIRSLRPEKVLELGTSLGISAAYQSAAVRLNGRGQLFALEGAPEVAAVAERNLRSLKLETLREVVRRRFSDTIQYVLERAGHIDFAFIGGHHDYDATLEYFGTSPRCAPIQLWFSMTLPGRAEWPQRGSGLQPTPMFAYVLICLLWAFVP